MARKTRNTSWKCQWRNEKRRFRSTKTSSFQSSSLLKRKGTRWLLNCRTDRRWSRILELSMRVWYRRTNQQQERQRQSESTLRSTTLLKPPRRRKNCSAMVMSSTPKTRSAKKRSRRWLQPCCTCKHETKTTATNLCRVRRVPTSNASRSSKTSAVLSARLCSASAETCSKCRQTLMQLLGSSWMSTMRRMKFNAVVWRLNR